tara:strand:- start:3641 stop:4060 length:420 start_codon:yes stop_codon:yes gene_type:complete
MVDIGLILSTSLLFLGTIILVPTSYHLIKDYSNNNTKIYLAFVVCNKICASMWFVFAHLYSNINKLCSIIIIIIGLIQMILAFSMTINYWIKSRRIRNNRNSVDLNNITCELELSQNNLNTENRKSDEIINLNDDKYFI